MQGISLAEGGTARRKLPIFGDGLELVLSEREKAVKTRQRLEGIALSATTAIAAEKTLAQIAQSLTAMPDDIACRTGVSLGRQLAASGKWVAAREMFLLVVARYAACGTAPVNLSHRTHSEPYRTPPRSAALIL